jgi:Microtubule associated protein (MAP65/ASE1 family)
MLCVALCAQRKVHDLDRFNNRGGNLLKEEQARNKIVVELPKVGTLHICVIVI